MGAAVGVGLPVTLLSWAAAFLPILVLLVLLVWLKLPSAVAAPPALAGAVLVAVLLFRTDARTIAVAAGKGIWDAIFVLYVIWPALILYNVVHEAGAFRTIERGLRNAMPDRLLVVYAFANVLTPFIQSIAGFGTPLAVATPLLIGLGVKPLYAVLLPTIGGAWANMFGSLGTTWFATRTVVSIPDVAIMTRYAAGLLVIPLLAAGLMTIWLYGRGWGLKRGLPAVLIVSVIQGALQFILVPLVPPVGTFLACSASLIVLFVLNRWKFYRRQDEDEPQRLFTDEGANRFYEENKAKEGREREEAPRMSLPLAFSPYAILAVLAVAALVISPVNRFLDQFKIGLPFPEASTGYGLRQEATGAYSAFAPLTHPGTILLLSAAAGYFIFRSRGLYGKEDSIGSVFSKAAGDALPATASITALLLISKVMDHSGEITVLALGIMGNLSSGLYMAASGFIGILGSLVTSSNTASNVLFAPLQATAAQAGGLPYHLVLAAQSAGGAVGNAVAPGDILLGVTVAGFSGGIGPVLRKAIPWTIVTGLLISAAVFLLYLLSGSSGAS